MGIVILGTVKELLDGPNFAHLATLMADGSPQSVPVWVGRNEDRIIVCTGEGTLKARNTLRDARVPIAKQKSFKCDRGNEFTTSARVDD